MQLRTIHHNGRLELPILLLMGIYTLFSFQPGLADQSWFRFLLAPALLFPGLSHGAADHHLDWKGNRGGLVLFVCKYVSIMLAILGLWLIYPIFGLSIFLLLSAWHFGETDLRDWGIYHPVKAFLFGVGILGILLLGHQDETATVLAVLKAEAFGAWLSAWYIPGIILYVVCCLIPAFQMPNAKWGSYLILLLIMAMGMILPLVAAFLWYFCAWHSLRGWMHLRLLTGYSDRFLLKVASPFIIGALLFFIIMLVLQSYFLEAGAQVYAVFFVFIAALSTPHILAMHQSYHQQSN